MTSSTTGSAPPDSLEPGEAGSLQPARSVGDLVRAAVSGWLGTALEFMDFQLYSLAAIVATGATPVIAASIVAATGSWIPVAVIIMVFSGCALFAALWMKEVAGSDLTDPNPAM